MEKKKIFVFGNPLIEKDSLALKVAEKLKGKLQGIEFVAVQSLDEVKDRNFLVLDAAEGVEKVQVIEDLSALATKQPLSGHDFDLGMELKVLKKVGKVGKVKIIAVPVGYKLEKAIEEVKKLLISSSSSL